MCCSTGVCGAAPMLVKALALGAKACLVGRPWVYGLAAGGTAGVERALEILRDEIDRTLALIGRPGVACVDASAVCTRPSAGWTASAVPSLAQLA